MKSRYIPKRPNYRPKVKKAANPFAKKSKQPDKELYGENWEILSDYVRKRDGYRCQISRLRPDLRCGLYLPPPFHNLLHAHHIIPLPKGSNHPSNLITLCVDCHGKLHNKYLGKISEKQRRAAGNVR